MSKYVIFTDSASDIPTDLRKAHKVEYFPMGVIIDGEEMIADMDWQIYNPHDFYKWLAEGRKMKTTLITVETFATIIRKWFDQGYDVLYLGCSTALTGSINSFNLAKEVLADEYPDRKMIAVPTFAASATLGMMVVDAAKEAEKGKSLEEVCKWVEENRFFYNQFCTVDTLTYLKEAGRCKGTAAFFGNIMGVKPVFISDRKGNNLVIEKVRGTKGSLDSLFIHLKDILEGRKDHSVWILHSEVGERVEYLKERIIKELGITDIVIGTLGPIVGITCGPGAIAVFGYGKEVTRYDGDGINV